MGRFRTDLTFRRITPEESRIYQDGTIVGEVCRQEDILNAGAHYYVIHLSEDHSRSRQGPRSRAHSRRGAAPGGHASAVVVTMAGAVLFPRSKHGPSFTGGVASDPFGPGYPLQSPRWRSRIYASIPVASRAALAPRCAWPPPPAVAALRAGARPLGLRQRCPLRAGNRASSRSAPCGRTTSRPSAPELSRSPNPSSGAKAPLGWGVGTAPRRDVSIVSHVLASATGTSGRSAPCGLAQEALGRAVKVADREDRLRVIAYRLAWGTPAPVSRGRSVGPAQEDHPARGASTTTCQEGTAFVPQPVPSLTAEPPRRPTRNAASPARRRRRPSPNQTNAIVRTIGDFPHQPCPRASERQVLPLRSRAPKGHHDGAQGPGG